MTRDVPRYVADVSSKLQDSLPLSPKSAAALSSRAGARVSLARRIYALPQRLEQLSTAGKLDPVVLRDLASADGDIARICDAEGGFDFQDADVEIFLDTIEGRFFDEAWTGEKRRADRFSTRNPKQQHK
jgi:hypothetical protein